MTHQAGGFWWIFYLPDWVGFCKSLGPLYPGLSDRTGFCHNGFPGVLFWIAWHILMSLVPAVYSPTKCISFAVMISLCWSVVCWHYIIDILLCWHCMIYILMQRHSMIDILCDVSACLSYLCVNIEWLTYCLNDLSTDWIIGYIFFIY